MTGKSASLDKAPSSTTAVSGGAPPSAVKEFLAGSVGGIMQVVTGNPFDTVKVRLQTQSSTSPQYAGFLDCVKQTFRNEGVGGFYKGALTPLVGIGACVSVQFAALESMKRYFSSRNSSHHGQLSTSQLYFAGAVSGVANSLLSGPIEHVRSRLQIQSTGARIYAGPIDFARKVVSQYGATALFKGQGITITREFHGYGMYFLVYEYLIQREIRTSGQSRKEIATWKQGLFGALSGYALWICIYPIDLIKSKLQCDAFDPKARAYKGAWDCLVKSVSANGISSLYKGFLTVMLRAGPVNAATFVGYEMAMNVLGR